MSHPYNYITYPSSYRTTLTQATNFVERAMRTAESSTSRVQMIMNQVSSQLNTALSALFDGTTEDRKVFLPTTLNAIARMGKDAASAFREVTTALDQVVAFFEELLQAMQPLPSPLTTSGPSGSTSTQANKSSLDINHPTSITVILNNFKSLNSMWNQMIQYAEKLISQASQALQMSSTNEIGLETERVQCSSEIDLSDLHCSTICENILWKPVACQQCETHFCSMCITKWLGNNPNQCPMRCDNFIQRSCSKFIARQLAKLQIACIYQPNGCNEVILYEALEKHEMICGYQLVKCTGCLLEMLQKDLTEHQSKCASVLMTCEDCKIVCRQNDVLTHHSDRICLREQLRQFQHESQYETQQLREQLRQAQRKIHKTSCVLDIH
ncbi:unnamed protein product [Adineta steineri]|uniref:Uncharacterized protein n=1 Tax=Adineta steineri TaxID=433720 RepID=A0A814KKZ6_9BILA|nr:unnamed protein product [Adineta steineri]CAF1012403.1 unnamed protein product [Adineta steineri]CAF1050995.1 unnamed protein product [Adineta steineri]